MKRHWDNKEIIWDVFFFFFFFLKLKKKKLCLIELVHSQKLQLIGAGSEPI